MSLPRCLPLLLSLGLAACASTDSKQVSSAAVTPLNDFNLVQAPIPPALQRAQQQPYLPPADQRCEMLAAEVRGLDDVLGPDLDAPASPTNPSLIERGSNAVGDAATGALRSAAEGVVPFRGWVRKLSGAERYSRDVAAAIAAGTVRRAYLKGLAHARGCPTTAATAAVSR
ncbi:hypothetical protein [Aquabacterium sp.]|uniref:hypothetical protein n=1 Tax=Aquabacterium sp. TaxID=1872578 RepID=UPI002CB196F2|nr:hypothetical protein [Aquabacterium sp.]HSW03658.1 hypothetical protein [Aquabacterium sp.]